MKEYNVIIIGCGAGADLVNDALAHNKTVALAGGQGAHWRHLFADVNIRSVATGMLIHATV